VLALLDALDSMRPVWGHDWVGSSVTGCVAEPQRFDGYLALNMAHHGDPV